MSGTEAQLPHRKPSSDFMNQSVTILLLLVQTAICPWLFGSETEPQTVPWDELQPDFKFNDPFEALEPEQLIDLSILARVEDLEKHDKLGVLTERKLKEAATARARLEQQQIDIDSLLARRGEIETLYQKRASAAEQSLYGKQIRIPGYLLPLRFSEERITEFLLVPWVGACIHTPPPPPNQMVHVVTSSGIEHRNRFSPIWVEGALKLQANNHELFLVDGSRDIEVAYAMNTNTIYDYSSIESDVLQRVSIPVFEGNEHSWLQQWQMKTELLFTKAMFDIKERHNSGPMLWGLLIAFAYGVLHTLGPGHGKAVVASYFIGEGGSFKRGVYVGIQIAICHVLSAVAVVCLADFAVRQATGHAPSDYRLIRIGSYALITGIGALMVWKAIRASKKQAHGHHIHDHSHHEDKCHACAALKSSKAGRHSSWLAFSVGAVPCTGALLVLLFGLANDLLGPAILLVMAISFGMAIAMSGIGILAITGHRMIGRRLDENKSIRYAANMKIAGAAAILLVGTTLMTLTIYDPFDMTKVPAGDAPTAEAINTVTD